MREGEADIQTEREKREIQRERERERERERAVCSVRPKENRGRKSITFSADPPDSWPLLTEGKGRGIRGNIV